jgi:hypothetical protein
MSKHLVRAESAQLAHTANHIAGRFEQAGGETYVYRPMSLADVERLAQTMVKGRFAPSSFRDNVSAVMCALMAGAEVGFTPFQSLQNIVVIKEKVSMYVNSMLALVQNAGLIAEGPRVEYTGEGDNLACTVKIKRVGRSDWEEAGFSMAEAALAGLNGEGWRKYPKRMLRHRAMGFVLQDVFPDVLRGMRTAEEMLEAAAQERAEKERIEKERQAAADEARRLKAAKRINPPDEATDAEFEDAPPPDNEAAAPSYNEDATEPLTLGFALASIDGCESLAALEEVAAMIKKAGLPDADREQAAAAYRARRQELSPPGIDGLSERLKANGEQ